MIFVLIEWCRGFLMPFPFWISDTGRKGEYLARRHYHRRGYHCLARNWRHGHGEVDAIMASFRRLVFLEVKTRAYRPDYRIGDSLGHEQEQRLKRLAETYLAQWPGKAIPWGYHLVLVQLQGRMRYRIQFARIC